MAPSASMEALRRKRDEALARPFPLTADLPDEFDDLFATWTDLRDQAIPAANAILEGRILRASDVRFRGLGRVRRRLATLEKKHPDIAGEYVGCFRALEALIKAVRETGRAAPT